MLARDGILGPFGGLRSNDAQSGSKSDLGWPNPPALASVLDSILPQMGECPAQARLGHLHQAIGPPAVGRFSWQSAARAQARLPHCHEKQRSSSAIPAVSAGGAIPFCHATSQPIRSKTASSCLDLTDFHLLMLRRRLLQMVLEWLRHDLCNPRQPAGQALAQRQSPIRGWHRMPSRPAWTRCQPTTGHPPRAPRKSKLSLLWRFPFVPRSHCTV